MYRPPLRCAALTDGAPALADRYRDAVGTSEVRPLDLRSDGVTGEVAVTGSPARSFVWVRADDPVALVNGEDVPADVLRGVVAGLVVT